MKESLDGEISVTCIVRGVFPREMVICSLSEDEVEVPVTSWVETCVFTGSLEDGEM
jgi:hypothetical protein